MSMSEEVKKDETKMDVYKPSQQYIEQAEAESLDFMNPKRWNLMNQMAAVFAQSGALPPSVKNAPQLIMIMQAGFEAGMKPIEAMSAFYFVNGKLSIYGEMAIAQVLKAGHSVEWVNCNDKEATCKITRGDNGKSLSSTYTMQQAIDRGLAKNPPYKTAPENMLKFKAFHMTAKFIVPEALHGISVKEVLEEDPTIVTVITNEPAKEVAKPVETPKATTLDAALAAKEPEPVKEEKPAKASKAKKSKAAELMEKGMEEAKAPESAEERYNRLHQESSDRRLTAEEVSFVQAYESNLRNPAK